MTEGGVYCGFSLRRGVMFILVSLWPLEGVHNKAAAGVQKLAFKQRKWIQERGFKKGLSSALRSFSLQDSPLLNLTHSSQLKSREICVELRTDLMT